MKTRPVQVLIPTLSLPMLVSTLELLLGPIVAAIRCASGREPITVGKPNTPAFDYIQRRWNIDPQRTMMVGDRMNTDVKFGRDHGLKTLLVLSGCHQLEDITNNRQNDRFDMVPDYCATCLGALVDSRVQS
ncbi:unnamed protein product [Strongylus vulgaris]|uniref:Uncharacterized protein n=1 Tax=Strongylus vulgaris TaxID=40348 RepID=A0A3P7J6G3_STRVU|nr:unnamed protein product [Strongylus vulgaris]